MTDKRERPKQRFIVSFDKEGYTLETFSPAPSMTDEECMQQARGMRRHKNAQSVVIVWISPYGIYSSARLP